jgi:ABC-type polar amino acid transport system ATPase subunit
MSLALELRSIHKRFSVGSGPCFASADVLRGVDLSVGIAETVAIVGDVAVGKSTLMLCAAGLLKPESGELRWFGDSSRAVAAQRVHYCCRIADLRNDGPRGEPHVHLLDLPTPIERCESLVDWIGERRLLGDSVVVVARDERFASRVAARVLTLAGGILRAERPARARVAERVAERMRQ